MVCVLVRITPLFLPQAAARTPGYLPTTHVEYIPGCNVTGSNTSQFAAVAAAAKGADYVIAVVGDSGGLGWTQNTDGEDDDRTDLDLPGSQPELIAAIAAAAPAVPVIGVLIHGRPATFVRHNILPKFSALLAAWRPGMMGGQAVWRILTGEANPSGRLSQAWPQSVGYVHSQVGGPVPFLFPFRCVVPSEKLAPRAASNKHRVLASRCLFMSLPLPLPLPLPPSLSPSLSLSLLFTRLKHFFCVCGGCGIAQASPWFHKRQGDFDEEPYRGGPMNQVTGHQDFPWGPQFPFGFGLSFTNFTLTLQGTPPTVRRGPAGEGVLAMSVLVHNVGNVAGKTVVAVFFSKPLSTFVRWHKMLAFFAKTPSINPGATATVRVSIPVGKLSSYNAVQRKQAVEPGTYVLTVAQNSVDPGTAVSANITSGAITFALAGNNLV